MPTACQPLRVSPSNRKDHTTARAGWTTCTIPMVPIAIDFWANTNRPLPAIPIRNARSRV